MNRVGAGIQQIAYIASVLYTAEDDDDDVYSCMIFNPCSVSRPLTRVFIC
jgi:hypothetical protein